MGNKIYKAGNIDLDRATCHAPGLSALQASGGFLLCHFHGVAGGNFKEITCPYLWVLLGHTHSGGFSFLCCFFCHGILRRNRVHVYKKMIFCLFVGDVFTGSARFAVVRYLL